MEVFFKETGGKAAPAFPPIFISGRTSSNCKSRQHSLKVIQESGFLHRSRREYLDLSQLLSRQTKLK